MMTRGGPDEPRGSQAGHTNNPPEPRRAKGAKRRIMKIMEKVGFQKWHPRGGHRTKIEVGGDAK